jgi:hypothetical protein
MAIKDLKLNPPVKKTELTKDNMLKFIKKYGTEEDKKWFVELMTSNKVKKTNNLTGAVVEGYDLPKVREAFAVKFFPTISSKSKNESKKSSKKSTFEEQLQSLL